MTSLGRKNNIAAHSCGFDTAPAAGVSAISRSWVTSLDATAQTVGWVELQRNPSLFVNKCTDVRGNAFSADPRLDEG
jgi:hypothetical protein